MKEQGGDKNYKLGRDGLFGGIFSGDKEVYRATAFIPVMVILLMLCQD